MEAQQAAAQPTADKPKKVCMGGCCQCRPVRILRNKCLENNNGDETACLDFINAFKMCVTTKRAEAAARRAQAETMI